MPEAATGGPGHNSDEEDRKVRYLSFVGRVVSQRAIVKAAQAELKQIKTEAKAGGFAIGPEIDFGVKFREAEDEKVVADNVRKTLRVAEYLGLPINYQTAFDFAAKPPGDGQIEAAYIRGERDGIMGIGPKAPEGYDGPLTTAYMEGWHAGQDKVKEVFQRDLEARNAADAAKTPTEILKPGRGRPRKDAAAPKPQNTSGSTVTPFKKKDAAAAKEPAGGTDGGDTTKH